METFVLRLPGGLAETFLEQMELEAPPSSSPFTGVTPASQPAGAPPRAAPSPCPHPQCPPVTPTHLISSWPQLFERTGPTEPVRKKYEYLKSVSWQEHKNDHHRWLETSDPYRFPSWLKAACMFHLIVKLTP